MTSEGVDVFDDEYLDDPITLIDFEQARINAINKNTDCSTTGLSKTITKAVDLTLNSDNTDSSYGKTHFVLPVTFFDISSNLKLLNECRPVAIKIVDCDKHPWYYKNYKVNASKNQSATEGNSEISNKFLIGNKVLDKKTVVKNREGNTFEKSKITKKRKKYKSLLIPLLNNVPYCSSKQDKETNKAPHKNNVTKIDFKRNVGLVGLKIKPRIEVGGPIAYKDVDHTQNNTLKEDGEVIEVDSYILGIDKALNSVGTIIVPINNEEDRQNKIGEIKTHTKSFLKKIKRQARKERKTKESGIKEILPRNHSNFIGKLVAGDVNDIVKDKISLPDISITKRSNVKDKTKTNKYINDLKKKITSENNVKSSMQLTKCYTNDKTSEYLNEPIINYIEKESPQSNLSSALIDPGIRSPVFPCNKLTSKGGFTQVKSKKALPQIDILPEKSNLDETININTSNINDNNKSTNTQIVELGTENIADDKARSTPLDSLKRIVISNIMSVSKHMEIKNTNSSTIHVDPKQSKESNTHCNRISNITVTTNQPMPTNQDKMQDANKGKEKDNKCPVPNNMTSAISSTRSIEPSSNRISDYIVSHKEHERSNHFQLIPPQSQIAFQPTSNILRKVRKNNTPANLNNYYKPFSSGYSPNFISNYCVPNIDHQKANFDQFTILHRTLNHNTPPPHTTTQSPLTTMMNAYWPYWLSLPPPPPPPPPPPSPHQNEEIQSNERYQPPKVNVMNMQVLTGTNTVNVNKNVTFPENSIINNRNQNINREKLQVLSKPPTETPAQPVNSKYEMFEELEKEMMSIHKGIPKENPAQRVTHVINICERPKPVNEKLLSDTVTPSMQSIPNILSHKPSLKRPCPKQLSLQQCNLYSHGKSLNSKLPNEISNCDTRLSCTQGLFAETNQLTNDNNITINKNPLSFLFGKKVSSHKSKIAPVTSKERQPAIINKTNNIFRGGIEKKDSNLKTNNGYSPPILPIPTYETSLQILSNNYLSNLGHQSQSVAYSHKKFTVKKANVMLDKSSVIANNISPKNRKPYENSAIKSKKISLDEYKERSKSEYRAKSNVRFEGTTDTLPCKRLKHTNSIKTAKACSDNVNTHSEQDLGYDSDFTIIL